MGRAKLAGTKSLKWAGAKWETEGTPPYGSMTFDKLVDANLQTSKRTSPTHTLSQMPNIHTPFAHTQTHTHTHTHTTRQVICHTP